MKTFHNQSGLLSCLGGFLLSLALSLDYSYPNLNTYITSCQHSNILANLNNQHIVSATDVQFSKRRKDHCSILYMMLDDAVNLELHKAAL